MTEKHVQVDAAMGHRAFRNFWVEIKNGRKASACTVYKRDRCDKANKQVSSWKKEYFVEGDFLVAARDDFWCRSIACAKILRALLE